MKELKIGDTVTISEGSKFLNADNNPAGVVGRVYHVTKGEGSLNTWVKWPKGINAYKEGDLCLNT